MGANAYRTISLYLIVISALDVPRQIIDAFRLPVPYYLGGNPPWLIWVCLPILWLNIDRSSVVGRGRLTVDREDMYFLFVMVFWCYLSWAQGSLRNASPGQTWFNLYLVTTNVWFYLYYFLLKTYQDRVRVQARLVDITINTVSWMAVVHVMLYILAAVGPAYFATLDIYDHNGVALVALFGAFLLLFHQPTDARWATTWLLVGVMLTVILLNRTRGAVAVFIVLLAWRLVGLRKMLVFAVTASGAVLAVRFVDLEAVGILWRGLSFGIANADTLAQETLALLPDNLLSAYARNAANVLLVREFLEYPLVGIGMDQAYNVRVLGYISHTYYLYPFAAFGLVGAVPYLLYFVVWPVRSGYRLDRYATSSTLLFLLGIMTVLNDWRAWYAIPFFLMLGDAKPQEAPTLGQPAAVDSQTVPA